MPELELVMLPRMGSQHWQRDMAWVAEGTHLRGPHAKSGKKQNN